MPSERLCRIWIGGDLYQLHGYSKSERKRKSFAIYSSSNHGSSGNDNGSSNNAGSYYSSSGDDCGTSPVLRLRSGRGLYICIELSEDLRNRLKIVDRVCSIYNLYVVCLYLYADLKGAAYMNASNNEL